MNTWRDSKTHNLIFQGVAWANYAKVSNYFSIWMQFMLINGDAPSETAVGMFLMLNYE